MEHEKWCVRAPHTGACSPKRGHWDRSTNTWQTDLTDADKRVIAEGLDKWQVQGEDHDRVMEWIRSWPTFARVGDGALRTWWMTKKRMTGMGRSWPV